MGAMSSDWTSPFRAALDEPAPPPPPEMDDENDDDEGGPHFHFHVMRPLVTVYSDGSMTTTGRGTLLVGWCVAATLALGCLAPAWAWRRWGR